MRRRQQNIREAARSMIERYGKSALKQVDQRIRELRNCQEDEAVLLWQEIRTSIKYSLKNKENGGSQK